MKTTKYYHKKSDVVAFERVKEEGYYVFSNKRNVIIADGFKTENEAKKFIYDYGLKYQII